MIIILTRVRYMRKMVLSIIRFLLTIHMIYRQQRSMLISIRCVRRFPSLKNCSLLMSKAIQPRLKVSGNQNAIDLKKPFPYYRYHMPSGKVYLVPYDPAVPTDTVAEGLAAMKEANGDIVEVLIPENVDYDVRVENDIAVITFKEQLDVTAFDQNELNQMIEGFMLTASGYDMQVRLENVVQESFGKYDLTTVLPMPIGSNPTFFPE